ncbi:MAG: FAD:protein FMN transferase [Bauldia sp.]|nr:FAD:protein FMN transferase [Bauldia sp.]
MALVETLAPTRPTGFSRRQVFKVLAATAAVPVGIAGMRWLSPEPTFHEWNGVVMGGLGSLALYHSDAGFAQATIARMITEVRRLEGVFSLFEPGSEISRLNADGAVAASRDLRAVLDLSRAVSEASGGAFDVTVQALWRLYETHFAEPGANPAGPPAEAIRAAVRLVDYTAVETAGGRARLGRTGMSVTLNAIAQGYITDRVGDLLRNEGFDHVVVRLGETRVLGARPDGEPWLVGVRDVTGTASRNVALIDRSLSVSGGYGTVFEASGQANHIFDPDTGRSAGDGVTTVAVTADRAAIADGLSTAIVVAGEARAPAILAAWPGTEALVIRGDGTSAAL